MTHISVYYQQQVDDFISSTQEVANKIEIIILVNASSDFCSYNSWHELKTCWKMYISCKYSRLLHSLNFSRVSDNTMRQTVPRYDTGLCNS